MYLWYSIYTRGAWHAYAPQADVENDPWPSSEMIALLGDQKVLWSCYLGTGTTDTMPGMSVHG